MNITATKTADGIVMVNGDKTITISAEVAQRQVDKSRAALAQGKLFDDQKERHEALIAALSTVLAA